MKNLLLGFLFVFSLTAFAVVTPSGISNHFDNTGTLQFKDSVDIMVKNGTGSSMAAGSLAALDLTADDGATVTTTTTLGDASSLCIVVNAIAAGKVGPCRVYGYIANAQLDATAGSSTAGANAYASTTAGKVQGTTPGATLTPVGVFLDTSSTSGDVELFVRIL